MTDVGDLAQTRNGDIRAAGEWIRADYAAARGEGGAASRPKIAGIGLALAHYAGGEVVYLPEADEARALRFLGRAAPDYLALRDSELHQTAYARSWFGGAVADACAEPVADLPPAAAARFRIWRWRCGHGEAADLRPGASPAGSAETPATAASVTPSAPAPRR